MTQEIFQFKKIAIVAILSTLVLLGSPTIAFAQPSNDDFDYATTIEELPFTETLDTTDATTANDDPVPTCISMGHTVWYQITPSTDMRLEVNTFRSDFDTVLSVYTSSNPTSLTEIICNDDAAQTLQSRVRFDASAGMTYYIMAGSFADNPGGNLVITVDEAPPSGPPLVIDLTIDPVGLVKPNHMVAIVSGTLTCSKPVPAFVWIQVEQRAGRDIIHGFSESYVECNGETPWIATISDADGVFVGGKANVNANAFAFDPDEDEYSSDEVSGIVELRGGNI